MQSTANVENQADSGQIGPSVVPESVPNGSRALTSRQRAQRATAHVTHGFYARDAKALKLRARRVRRLCIRAMALLPWLQDGDMPALRGWAELEALGSRAFLDLAEHGLSNEKGEPRRLLADWRALKQTQLAYERELGMTPASRAALGLKVALGQQADAATELARRRADMEAPGGTR
jgi:hypothetical protein